MATVTPRTLPCVLLAPARSKAGASILERFAGKLIGRVCFCLRNPGEDERRGEAGKTSIVVFGSTRLYIYLRFRYIARSVVL